MFARCSFWNHILALNRLGLARTVSGKIHPCLLSTSLTFKISFRISRNTAVVCRYLTKGAAGPPIDISKPRLLFHILTIAFITRVLRRASCICRTYSRHVSVISDLPVKDTRKRDTISSYRVTGFPTSVDPQRDRCLILFRSCSPLSGAITPYDIEAWPCERINRR